MRRLFAFVIVVALLLTLAPPLFDVQATTRVVTNCNDDQSIGSLRRAINSVQAGDTVSFLIDCPATAPIVLTGPLNFAVNITIDATSPAHQIVISGNHQYRILIVNSGVTATFVGLTIVNGTNNGPGYPTPCGNGYYCPRGGAVENNGTMMMRNCTISDSAVTVNEGGGGIANVGTMTLTNTTVQNNSTPLYGGGIANLGTLTMDHSTVSNNSSTRMNTSGGGIYNPAR